VWGLEYCGVCLIRRNCGFLLVKSPFSRATNDRFNWISEMKITEKTSICLSAFLGLLCLTPVAQAARTDVVRLINGDDVTGEVKSLEFSELRFSTDSMGTVSIEWEEIVSLTSDQSLQVEVASGTRYFGNLLPASADGLIAVGRGENVQELEILAIVRITPIETDEKIWQRLEGSVKFGFDSDKASAVTSANLNANVRYRTRTYLLGLDITGSFTDQPGAETTQNTRIAWNYQRFRTTTTCSHCSAAWSQPGKSLLVRILIRPMPRDISGSSTCTGETSPRATFLLRLIFIHSSRI
jgi:hypothetical protein